jgi:hypothetical protein
MSVLVVFTVALVGTLSIGFVGNCYGAVTTWQEDQKYVIDKLDSIDKKLDAHEDDQKLLIRDISKKIDIMAEKIDCKLDILEEENNDMGKAITKIETKSTVYGSIGGGAIALILASGYGIVVRRKNGNGK